MKQEFKQTTIDLVAQLPIMYPFHIDQNYASLHSLLWHQGKRSFFNVQPLDFCSLFMVRHVFGCIIITYGRPLLQAYYDVSSNTHLANSDNKNVNSLYKLEPGTLQLSLGKFGF